MRLYLNTRSLLKEKILLEKKFIGWKGIPMNLFLRLNAYLKIIAARIAPQEYYNIKLIRFCPLATPQP